MGACLLPEVRRADYLAALFNVIDWIAVSERYADALRQEALAAHLV